MNKSLIPFLHIPFDPETPFSFPAGWLYEKEEIAIHGVENHKAIDFALPKGTPIYAAADGWAIATFGERLLLDGDKPRTYRGKAAYFGSGLMVQIWHPGKGYTQYLHLESIDPAIPYFKPRIREQDVLNAPELRVPIKEYGHSVRALRVTSGHVIGTVGCTGLGIGESTFAHRENGKDYLSWDSPHLHFAVCGSRAPYTRDARRVDPFGIYGRGKEYPIDPKEWSTLPGSLWTDVNGQLPH